MSERKIADHWQRRTNSARKRVLREQRFRMIRFAVFTFSVNLLYALYHGALGIINQSLWLITMCAYYIILSIMRSSVILCEYKNRATPSEDREYFVMKLCGVLLVILSIVLAGANYISLSQNIAIKRDKIMMIAIATYSFTKLTAAIAKAVRQRKKHAPLLMVLRTIGYAEAAASILTLQRSMLVSFDGMGETEIRMMNILSGSAVYLFVLALGGIMIHRGITKKGQGTMKKSKIEKAQEEISKKAVDTFTKIEDAVVGGYTHIQDAVVGSYTKVEDAFVSRYLTRDGETVEQAKARLKSEQEQRTAARK